MKRFWMGVVALVLGGCEERVVDVGVATVIPVGAQTSDEMFEFVADGRVQVFIEAVVDPPDRCCGIDGSCTVEVFAGEIVIESQFVFDTRHRCKEDCGLTHTACDSPPIPADTYAVHYGAGRKALVVPSTTELFTVAAE